MNLLGNYAKLFIDSLMPLKCPGCDTEGMTHGLCAICWANLRIITFPMCKICGIPFQYDSNLLCAQCLKSMPDYDYCRAFAIYSNPVRSIITKLKQYSCPIRTEILARWIYSTINWNEIDYIAYIPSSKLRLLYRGYNPIANICHSLQYIINKPIISILGAYHTELQQGKTAQERKRNVKSKFFIKDINIQNNTTICLIDDVTTTGSTLNYAAKIIKKKYQVKVICVAAAKTCNYIY